MPCAMTAIQFGLLIDWGIDTRHQLRHGSSALRRGGRQVPRPVPRGDDGAGDNAANALKQRKSTPQ